ncbi:MAG: translocation/assembly module TamB domain-containing protein [Treponema sp.]|nr:translocation/assembly module TamB domain-containing protein [Treponema sp.]MEE3435287.1 translocation/assembly module TamB domain-containing protein [Treponema sp.]
MKFKQRYIKIGVCVLFFLSLLVAVNRLLQPLYVRIGTQIQKTVDSYRTSLKENAGLLISYKSLSPSILSGVSVNGISVVDSKSGLEVASVGRLYLDYSLRDILNGRPDSFIEGLLLRDVEIKILSGENDFWLSQILEKRKASQSAGLEQKLYSERFKELLEKMNLQNARINLGSDLRVYRLRFVFKSGAQTFEAAVSKAQVGARGQNKIDVNFSGAFDFFSGEEKFSGALDFSALIPRGVEGSSAVLRFSNLSALNYRARFIGFLAEYRSQKLSFKMLPSARNIYAEASVDFESADCVANLFADGFNMNNFVQTSNSDTLTQGLFGMNFSLKASAKYNYRSDDFGYNSSGDIFVPADVIPAEKFQSDTIISYSLYGNEKRITIPYFKTSGERYNLSFDGAFDFASKRPSGTLSVESFVLPNGGEISTEIFIEEYKNGFMCFAPQVFFGENVYTAAQLTALPSADSWDWTFEVSDYSHDDEPGVVSVFGSYSSENKAAQASLSFSAIYLDSIVKTAAFFAEENMKPLLMAASDAVKSYVFSCDIFASGVGKEFSFSVPYALLANTSRDDQMLILEADGNDQTFQLSRLEFIFGGQKIVMDGLVEKLADSKDRLLNGRLELNGIPYTFSGLANKRWIEINSEYGLRFTLKTDTSGEVAKLDGSFEATGFPVKINNRTFSFTTESNFSYSIDKGIRALVPYFDGRLLEGTSSLDPVITFAADIDQGGAYFDSLTYSDNVSTLNGSGVVVYRFDEDVFESADFNFDLSNSMGEEKIKLEGNFVNSLKTPLTVGSLFSGTFLNNLFITTTLNVDSLRSERFFAGSENSDTVNANIVAQGMASNPFVSIDIPSAVMTIQGKPLRLTAQAVVEDKVFSIQKAEATWGDSKFTNILADFDQKTWDGKLTFDLKTNLFGNNVLASAQAKVQALSEVGKGVPDSLNIEFDAIEKKADKKRRKSYHIGLMKIQNQLIVSSSQNIGLNGTITDLRDLDLEIKNTIPFNMKIQGSVSKEDLNVSVSDIQINGRELVESLGVKIVRIFKGVATGGFMLTGPVSDPKFYGQIDIPNAEFNFPNFFRKHASTPMISLFLEGSQFYTEPTRCHLQNQPLDVTVSIQMNRLALDSLEVRIQTIKDNFVPLNINLSEIHVKGDFLADLAVTLENDTIGVSGDLTAKNANAEFGATRIDEIISGLAPVEDNDDDDDGMPVDVDLRIRSAQRVQISYSTFLRAVIVPGSEMEVSYSSEDKRLVLDGNVPIRSGEIVYMNSSFYIREGEIHFSSNDESFDPSVSVLAECKTRDENSEPVTITLQVERQRLSQLSPRLSSSPARSEREIMEILGGLLTANSNNAASLALATGDYALQSVLIRRLENALRDFFKFDIFSVRTMVVQNAVKQSVNRNSSGSDNLTGNYLDGTTVYIGKYFGEAIFADAMLRLDYDRNRRGNNYTYDGISLRPELGFELAAPFAKVRWSMSPDLESILNMKIVENTALTLSWKFSF